MNDFGKKGGDAIIQIPERIDYGTPTWSEDIFVPPNDLRRSTSRDPPLIVGKRNGHNQTKHCLRILPRAFVRRHPTP
jgi:hypothetical protein